MITEEERTQSERRITRALFKARKRELDELLSILGNPPDARKYARVPDRLWKEIEEKEKNILIPFLFGIALVSAGRVADKIGFETDPEPIARRFAERQAGRIARDATRNTRSLLRDLTRRLTKLDEDAVQEAADEGIEGIFGPGRAENTGITETTGADTGGGRGVVDRARDSGVVVVLYWVTSRMPNVCPICRPLHGTTEDVWSVRFPDGPPAHPRCFCELRYSTGERQGRI